jgi:hypothetical protein
MSRRLLAAQATSLGIAVAIAIAYLLYRDIFNVERAGADMDAYWNAALRLREGLPLYPPLDDVDASSVFRYPAWFAFAWIPLTLLPKVVASVAWIAAMLVASAAALVPAMRSGSTAGLVLSVLMAPILLEGAWLGNVEPLLVAALIWGMGTRLEPAAIALAAATKLTPIAFIAIPLARRDLFRAGMATGLTGALTIPTLLAGGAAGYPVDVGGTLSLWSLSPLAWVLGAIASAAVLVQLTRRRSPYLTLGAAVASLAIVPRLNVLHVAQCLVGLPADRSVVRRTPVAASSETVTVRAT